MHALNQVSIKAWLDWTFFDKPVPTPFPFLSNSSLTEQQISMSTNWVSIIILTVIEITIENVVEISDGLGFSPYCPLYSDLES